MNKVYLASSWKNKKLVDKVDVFLKSRGFEVSNFTHPDDRDYLFNWDQIPNSANMTQLDVMQIPLVNNSFKEDKGWLDWADWIFLILPCGKSAHLEAGYAAGSGKKLAIYAEEFPKGEFDSMYGFCDIIGTNLEELVQLMKRYV